MTHPITPPPELVQEWLEAMHGPPEEPSNYDIELATCAAQWGANQELEACCEWLHWQNLATHQDLIPSLRAARRPKPPSLKELALEALDQADKGLNKSEWQQCSDTIRRALEQLDD
jgi:hypothetical protein